MQDLIVCRATKSSHPNKTSAASPKHRVLHTPPDRDQRSGKNHDEICRMDTHLSMRNYPCFYLCNYTYMIVLLVCMIKYTSCISSLNHDHHTSCLYSDTHTYRIVMIYVPPAPWRVPRLTSQTNSSGGPSSAHSPAAPGTGALRGAKASVRLQENHETWLENW